MPLVPGAAQGLSLLSISKLAAREHRKGPLNHGLSAQRQCGRVQEDSIGGGDLVLRPERCSVRAEAHQPDEKHGLRHQRSQDLVRDAKSLVLRRAEREYQDQRLGCLSAGGARSEG